mmetsp:Transcript_44070/g.125717  ORF Transcript_44070/g.125717 Transcript_44070/m.125717 type:complete len:385 (+) Transcript_44070:624-1778(+)
MRLAPSGRHRVPGIMTIRVRRCAMRTRRYFWTPSGRSTMPPPMALLLSSFLAWGTLSCWSECRHAWWRLSGFSSVSGTVTRLPTSPSRTTALIGPSHWILRPSVRAGRSSSQGRVRRSSASRSRRSTRMMTGSSPTWTGPPASSSRRSTTWFGDALPRGRSTGPAWTRRSWSSTPTCAPGSSASWTWQRRLRCASWWMPSGSTSSPQSTTWCFLSRGNTTLTVGTPSSTLIRPTSRGCKAVLSGTSNDPGGRAGASVPRSCVVPTWFLSARRLGNGEWNRPSVSPTRTQRQTSMVPSTLFSRTKSARAALQVGPPTLRCWLLHTTEAPSSTHCDASRSCRRTAAASTLASCSAWQTTSPSHWALMGTRLTSTCPMDPLRRLCRT